MVLRKHRLRVVLDTNVFVRAFKARANTNPNQRIIRLWLRLRRIQLVVSGDLVDEYLGVFSDVLNMDDDVVANWRLRFLHDSRSTWVNLGRRFFDSRDPDDNLLLATAFAGKAAKLLTNDRDLLDIPIERRKAYPFDIQTPAKFLGEFTLK
jgi:putative PIN family toxin of toxin-antitoxin system